VLGAHLAALACWWGAAKLRENAPIATFWMIKVGLGPAVSIGTEPVGIPEVHRAGKSIAAGFVASSRMRRAPNPLTHQRNLMAVHDGYRLAGNVAATAPTVLLPGGAGIVGAPRSVPQSAASWGRFSSIRQTASAARQ